ncbi:hypothetical protein A7D17_02740 [Xanthomonas floridensis]|uniref:Uncharacterized protein n=2 Tax=Xanthomonas floridensis TaxID=1843580 RepID=A0A1A9MD25_9XANT|nr:hypothetical protein A7D17_02740 [Xanthomonas floridensis]
MLAAGAAAPLAGCAADDTAAVRSVDEQRLRHRQPPMALGTTLDMQLDWQQQPAPDPAFATPAGARRLDLAAATRVGRAIVAVRLRETAAAGAAPVGLAEWTYAVECRGQQTRSLGAGIAIGAGLPGALSLSVPAPARADRTRLLGRVRANRTACALRNKANACERVRAASLAAPSQPPLRQAL